MKLISTIVSYEVLDLRESSQVFVIQKTILQAI